jgi:hypothetical protein
MSRIRCWEGRRRQILPYLLAHSSLGQSTTSGKEIDRQIVSHPAASGGSPPTAGSLLGTDASVEGG